MTNKVETPVVLENVRIGFRNFSGKEGQYNQAGKRNFCVFLDAETARAMADDGWNVRFLHPRDEDEEPQAYLQVAVAYRNIPPRIVLVTSKGKTKLDEDAVSVLDWADIKNVDLIVRPYNWEVNGKAGVKAYVKSLFVTLNEDELERKYMDVPDSAQAATVADTLSEED